MDEKVLKQALEDTFDIICGYPEELEFEEHVFSEKFERKMQKIIRRERRSYYTPVATILRRIAAILIIVIAIGVPVLSVEAVREQFVSFFVNIFPTHNEININQNAEAQIDIDEITINNIEENLPEDFELIKSIDSEIVTLREYANSEYFFSYKKKMTTGDVILTDNESAEYEAYTDENGREYMIYESVEHSQTVIFWLEGDSLVKVISNMPREDIFEIF